jgi:DNA processing protein
MRNRIIAGLCDAIVVVEAAAKGGALITAEIANSYNRDVFAVPGRISDPFSEGTNQLVRANKAALIQNAEDLAFLMGWKEHSGSQQVVQKQLFREMTPDEEKIFNLIQERGQVGIDEISIGSELSQGQVSTALLNLEFDGVVKSLPGKVYVLG